MTSSTQTHNVTEQDLDVLNSICEDDKTVKRRSNKSLSGTRRPSIDPLILALAASRPPTYNHYHHDYYPNMDYGLHQKPKLTTSKISGSWYQSQQKPRRERLAEIKHERRNSAKSLQNDQLENQQTPPPLEITCQVRTRVPTPHGEIFCHLYTNNRDKKEHLALVVDPSQFKRDYVSEIDIRSHSLDSVRIGESELDRLTRGAYVGRIKRTSSEVDKSSTNSLNSSNFTKVKVDNDEEVLPPLVRIHSECFTGETIGSMRCDCGEQLDEALRQMFASTQNKKGNPRGVIVYMKQEGRGIGLAAKLRAYNLQDLGHDTVTANELLGFGADERTYEISASILRDLGLGAGSSGIRLMTNNPDKVSALEGEGIPVFDRVEMIPRAWKCNHEHSQQQLQNKSIKHVFTNPRRFSTGGEQTPNNLMSLNETDRNNFAKGVSINNDDAEGDSGDEYNQHVLRRSGATLIGAGVAHGDDLERYLRTKVNRMGHLLSIPKDKEQH